MIDSLSKLFRAEFGHYRTGLFLGQQGLRYHLSQSKLQIGIILRKASRADFELYRTDLFCK